MISGYFGVPGCGKTTVLAMKAQKELKRIKKGKSKYKHVYTNFYCKGCNKIDFKDLEHYKVYDGLILIDEISLDADNREYKTFGKGVRNFCILHRHIGCDIIYFTQDFSKVDKTIRSLTNDLWYVSKTVVPFFDRWTVCKQIYRQITINEFTSELSLGYRFASFLEIVFGHTKQLVYRPHWYKFFDSFNELQLEDVPELDNVRWDL